MGKLDDGWTFDADSKIAAGLERKRERAAARARRQSSKSNSRALAMPEPPLGFPPQLPADSPRHELFILQSPVTRRWSFELHIDGDCVGAAGGFADPYQAMEVGTEMHERLQPRLHIHHHWRMK